MSSRFKLYKDPDRVKAQRKKDNNNYWNKCKNGINTGKQWTEEENIYLLTSTDTYENIAKYLGRGINAITVQKSKLLKGSKMELGNMMFNSNVNHIYECPDWIIALLRDIERRLNLTMFAINHEEYDNPFDNTGNSFRELSDVFEVQAYNWNDEESQDYNFVFKTKSILGDIKISWYKYLGRDTTINYDSRGSESVMLSLYNECIEALDKYREEHENNNILDQKKTKTNLEAEWEIGNSNDEDVIYLYLKGKFDMRYSRFHLNVEDAQRLSNDISTVILNSYFKEPKLHIMRVREENKNE